MSTNIYGMQHTTVTEPRDGWDMAMGTTAGMSAGSELGSNFGPGGSYVGAAVGGLLGYAGQKRAKWEEKQQKKNDEAYNRFVDNLSDRSAPSANIVRAQARYGMENRGKYRTDIVEIEGDGSGDPVNGIGEIHVDKNYNIKNAAIGAKRHENGGYKIATAEKGMKDESGTTMKKGDIIFPWQNDREKFEKGMRMIKRYKLNGDPRAKEWLDREAENLPTDADYGYDNKGSKKYPDGVDNSSEGSTEYTKANLRELFRKTEDKKSLGITKEDIQKMSNNEVSDFMANYYANQGVGIVKTNPPIGFGDNSKEAANLASNDMVDKNGNVGKSAASTGGSVVSGQEDATKDAKMEVKSDSNGKRYLVGDTEYVDMGDGYLMKYNHLTEKLESNKKGTDKWYDVSDQEKKGDLNQAKTTKFTNYNVTRDHYFNKKDSIYKPKTVEKPADAPAPAAETVATTEVKTDAPAVAKTAETTPPAAAADNKKVSKEADVAKDTADWVNMFRNNRGGSNPGAYASALNNLVMGTKPAERVTRRYLHQEDLDYNDRSAAQRRAITEQRNATNMMLRGKGLSTGQQQSYLGQAGAQALSQHEAINEAEARRADAVDQFNTQQRNQSKQTNLGLANQYDTEDAQNRAAKQRYMDQGMADLAELSQYNDQRRYMMSRDAKLDDVQQKSIGLTGTNNYGFEGGDWTNVKYINEDGVYSNNNKPINYTDGQGKAVEVLPNGNYMIGGKIYTPQEYQQYMSKLR